MLSVLSSRVSSPRPGSRTSPPRPMSPSGRRSPRPSSPLARMGRCCSKRQHSVGSAGAALGSMTRRKSEYKDPAVAALAERVSAIEQARQRSFKLENRKKTCLIDPRTSLWIGWWDMVISISLLFTATFTPVEVSFMDIPQDRWADPLFITNRVVDCIFIVDMVLQFFLMFPAEKGGSSGAYWVVDHREIARKYIMSGWFTLDFFSIGVSGFDIFSPEDSGASRLKALRAVRVLRMLKLVRLARGSRIFKRWEMRLSINYAMLQIVNICVMLLFVCHLFACIWGLQASFDPLASWLGIKGYCVPYNATQDGPCPSNARCDEDEAWQCESAGAQYLYSLYWSST